eukprot:TRINITY_DN87146_c0_g1_i1.p1 TRINITY_DN87146_c0_g1~~TRINITY_DN87146_c0_g1_i1.p1  ORF type:complete len:869 (-),score=130.71 TRINITY_DN87146_c0_g1_i1:212-2776(-)
MAKAVAVALFTLILEASLQAAHGEAKVLKFPHAELIDGCFYKNARYGGPGETLEFKKRTIYECQKQCVLNASWGCEFFGFFPASGACYLGGSNSTFTQSFGEGGYTGPRVCPERPVACTETPSADFPGVDERSSSLAWPSHKVPGNMECWPKDYVTHLFKSCPGVKVLEDTASGWPGRCLGLKQVVVPLHESCQSWCGKQVSCSVWQEVDRPYPDPAECWHSYFSPGSECFTRALHNGSEAVTWKPKRAQRIQHGQIRVLKKLSSVEIKGLRLIFDQNYFIDQTQAVEACRISCYSDIGCQWWYYNKATGCFGEDVNRHAFGGMVTSKFFSRNSTFAEYLLDGEYIQHICPSAGDASLSSHEPIPTYTPPTTSGTTTTSALTTTASRGANETLPANREIKTSTTEFPLIAPGHEVSGNTNSEKDGLSEAQGALAITDVDYSKLRESDKVALGSKYAGLIARHLGVDENNIFNLQNEAGTTNIDPWTPNTAIFRRLQSQNGSQDGISAPFHAILDESGQAGVSKALAALEHPGFKRAVQEDTFSVLKDVPGAITSDSGMPGQPDVALMEMAGNAAHEASSGSKGETVEANKPNTLNNAWVWVLGTALVLGILALIAWIIWIVCGSGNSKMAQKARNNKVASKGASYSKFKDADVEEDRPLFRGSSQAQESQASFDRSFASTAQGSDKADWGRDRAAPLVSPNILTPPEPLKIPELPQLAASLGAPGVSSSGMPNFAATSAMAGVAAAQTYSSAMAQMQPQVARSAVAPGPANLYSPAAGVQYSYTTAAPVAMASPVGAASRAAQFGLPTQFPQLQPMDLFDRIDTDGDGVISREELAAGAAQVQAARSQAQGRLY